jgi:hypothetical protein
LITSSPLLARAVIDAVFLGEQRPVVLAAPLDLVAGNVQPLDGRL